MSICIMEQVPDRGYWSYTTLIGSGGGR
jgi:hypothetical protein